MPFLLPEVFDRRPVAADDDPRVAPGHGRVVDPQYAVRVTADHVLPFQQLHLPRLQDQAVSGLRLPAVRLEARRRDGTDAPPPRTGASQR